MSTTVDGNSGGSAVTTTTLPTLQGQVLQVVNYQTGAVATGTTTIPADDTIPQITEGNEYMTLAITPKSATSVLIVSVVFFGAGSVAGQQNISVALFQDATANALASVYTQTANTNAATTIPLTHKMTSGTTSATTFRVRAGLGAAGTTTFNGFASGRAFGGVAASSITITEVVP